MGITSAIKIAKTPKKRLGIFLGSFNPIHNGHLQIATSAIIQDLVDEILFVPTMQNPWKDEYEATFWDRCTMIRRAISPFSKCILSEMEAFCDPPYYTCNTLKALRNYYTDCELLLIVGSDIVDQIITWKYGEWILKNFKCIVVGRPGYNGHKVDVEEVSSLSSTEIRNKVKEGKSIENLVPRSVANYIEKTKLYI